MDNFFIDYIFENDKLEVALLDYMSRDGFVIRRIIDARAKGTVVTPICLSNPIASELEI